MLEISSGIGEWLMRRIEEFACDSNEPEYLRTLASRHRVLPLLVDWTGFWGLRADGEILFVGTEDGQGLVVEIDARHQRIVLFQGAKKYRELEPLLPKRPDTAQDCPSCLGTGNINMPGIAPETIICYCGGCGWLI
jgi:hypothetical protein